MLEITTREHSLRCCHIWRR